MFTTMKSSVCLGLICLAAAAYAAPRVIGGKEAGDGKYPYDVSIKVESEHWCGGSILNERWIMTAAQCLINKEQSSIKVVLGTNDLSHDDNGQTYQVEYLVHHEDYSSKTKHNDIGLIRVNKDIEFSDRVQPIRLPGENLEEAGYPVTLTGWGSLDNSGKPNNKLHEVKLNIFDQTQCGLHWIFDFTITKSQICTAGVRGLGSCYGDSGSALVADGVQLGIASFGNPCGRGSPDVFTRVYSFLDWIAEKQAKFH